jgi:hypothetical protein
MCQNTIIIGGNDDASMPKEFTANQSSEGTSSLLSIPVSARRRAGIAILRVVFGAISGPHVANSPLSVVGARLHSVRELSADPVSPHARNPGLRQLPLIGRPPGY